MGVLSKASPVVEVNNEGVVSKLLEGFVMVSIHVACAGGEHRGEGRAIQEGLGLFISAGAMSHGMFHVLSPIRKSKMVISMTSSRRVPRS